MKQLLRVAVIAALVLAFQHTALANNVVVSNIALTGQNAASDFTLVQFDITWDNSWQVSTGPSNRDACWVFVKYSTDSGTTWDHATLATSGHTAPSGSTIDTPSDGKGVFIYRSSYGTGTVNFTSAQLRWEYGTDGVLDNATVQVKVFAIEMVFVPEAAFSVGSGGTETAHFFEGGGNNPFQINSEGAITVGNSAGQLYYGSGPASGDQTGPIPAAFPKGFGAFYCMKYEITQEQYRDFLNCLTYDQQNTRTATSPDAVAGTGALSSTNSNRQGIDIQTPGVASTTPAVYANNLDGDSNFNESVDGQTIACNFLSWMDGAAYRVAS